MVIIFCLASPFLYMGVRGCNCDRYDGWIDENLPLLSGRFKV